MITGESVLPRNDTCYTSKQRVILSSCTLCPRECRVDRFHSSSGVCGTDAGFHIASVCIHRGEEPAIMGEKGICNIFFTGCNLHCIYCQNHQISRARSSVKVAPVSLQAVLDRVEEALDQGVRAVGLVSPSHVVPQAVAIIRGLHSRGRKPVIVWNTNAYEKPETIRSLEGLVDVYLPDLKYISPNLSAMYSGMPDYPVYAKASIREMYRQKGSSLITGDDGQAESGLVIRHLVLPCQAEESIGVLKYIAEEISTGVSISLMAQYHPVGRATSIHGLNRTITDDEYGRVTDAFHKLGFRKGWIQEPGSPACFMPDFGREQPFG